MRSSTSGKTHGENAFYILCISREANWHKRGLSTRVIGVMCMLHGDDKGLVMPPRVARLQSIIIPVGITNKMSAEDKAAHNDKVEELYQTLKKAGVRTDVDARDGQ